MQVNNIDDTLRRIMKMCSDAEDDIDLIKENLKRQSANPHNLRKSKSLWMPGSEFACQNFRDHKINLSGS